MVAAFGKDDELAFFSCLVASDAGRIIGAFAFDLCQWSTLAQYSGSGLSVLAFI